ncbi:MAG: TIGR02266 family protein [Proteobacteria bacterium]|nr:TIGR02266 family protein [Pseudomonadota bacterium]
MAKVSVQAASDESQSGAERRRSLRADLTVRVDYSTVDELFSEFTRDINEGGLFIETTQPRPQGTVVSLVFNLPGCEEPIRTIGRVAWSSGAADPPGMGVEFDDLTGEQRTRINHIVRALRSCGPQASG